MTKQEAIAKIDKLLDEQFEDFVNATCNVIVTAMNESAAVGKRRYKGEFRVGYCVSYPPMNKFYKALFVLDKERIVSYICSAAEKDRVSMKSISKYTNRWNLHAEYSEETDTQEMGLVFAGTFFMTQTGKRFCEEVKKKLSPLGVNLRLKCFAYGCTVKYSFVIPDHYQRQPLHSLPYQSKVTLLQQTEQILHEKKLYPTTDCLWESLMVRGLGSVKNVSGLKGGTFAYMIHVDPCNHTVNFQALMGEVTRDKFDQLEDLRRTGFVSDCLQNWEEDQRERWKASGAASDDLCSFHIVLGEIDREGKRFVTVERCESLDEFDCFADKEWPQKLELYLDTLRIDIILLSHSDEVRAIAELIEK